MVTRFTSAKTLENYLKTFDATAEVFVTVDLSEAVAYANMVPGGKFLANMGDSGSNLILIVVTATGVLAGIRATKVKGGHFLAFTGTALPDPALGTPVTVLTHSSPKALETYLKTIDPAATVTVYSNEATVDEAGDYFRIAVSLGRITVIRGLALAPVMFIMDKGGFYTTVKK